MSGDKYGEMCTWRYDTQQRHVWSPHEYLVTSMAWGDHSGDNTVYTGSADGLVKSIDLDTYDSTPLMRLNPLGWQGKPKQWRMVYALGGGDGCLWAGDDVGNIHILDPRGGAGGTHGRTVHQFNAHGKNNKVQYVHSNPRAPWLMATCGNDKAARVWDARMLKPPARARASWPDMAGELWASHGGSASNAADVSVAVVTLLHPRAVNAAVWSPVSGRKLMTTCLDNRIRIWDNPMVLHGAHAAPPTHPSEVTPSTAELDNDEADSEDDDFENTTKQSDDTIHAAASVPTSGADLDLGEAHPPPSSTLIHSHDFGRYLSPFRAQWDPKDTAERLVVCGRYISEDFNGVKLHPIDLLDAQRGRSGVPSSTVVTQLVDPIVPTICPVNAVSPHEHAVATGSSMSMFVWKPVPPKLLSRPTAPRSPGDTSKNASSSASAAAAPSTSGGPAGHVPWWELPEYTLALQALEASGSKKGKGGKGGKAGGVKRSRSGGDVARSFTAAAAAAAGMPSSTSAAVSPAAPSASASLDVLVCSGREGGATAYNVAAALNKNKKAAAAKARAARRDTAEARAVKAKAEQSANARAEALFQKRAAKTLEGCETPKSGAAHTDLNTSAAPASTGASIVDLTSPEGAQDDARTPAQQSTPPPSRTRRPRSKNTPPERVSPYFSPPKIGGASDGVAAAEAKQRTAPRRTRTAARTQSPAAQEPQQQQSESSLTPLQQFAYSAPSVGQGVGGGLRSARRLDSTKLRELRAAATAPTPSHAAATAAGPSKAAAPSGHDSSDDSDFADALPASLLLHSSPPPGGSGGRRGRK